MRRGLRQEGRVHADWGAAALEHGEHAMVYHEGIGRVLLYGGNIAGGWGADTWAYDGQSWTQVITGAAPPARAWLSLAYDPLRKAVWLFGGELWAAKLGDLWTLRYESTWPDEVCLGGLDEDGDGLLNCQDPDCEGLPRLLLEVNDANPRARGLYQRLGFAALARRTMALPL